MFMYMYVLGDTKPKESDLFRYIVPKFAENWRDLGVLLEISNHHLDIIAVDNTNHPAYNEQCCKAMLQKWIEIAPNLTWDTLQKSIGSLPGLFHNDSTESTYTYVYFIHTYIRIKEIIVK